MRIVRYLTLSYPRGVLLLMLAALATKLLVPGGYMLAPEGRSITISLCSGYGPLTAHIDIPIGKGKDEPHTPHHNDGAAPCPFSALALHSLAAVDSVPVMSALLPVFTARFFIRREAPIARRAFLRPPLRAPPTRS